MRAPLKSLGETFGALQSPITAGRDTRMLTALVMTSGAPADFFTLGAQDDVDVVIATAVARRLGLPHRRVAVAADDLAADGEEVACRIVQRNDGLVTLMHARSALDMPERVERLPVLLYGGGGERTRGKLLTPAFVLRPTSAAAEATVLQAFDRGGPLLRPEARELVVEHIVRTCRALHELGFAPEDVPDAFEQSEHSRRWAAAQAFQRADHRDVFVPFFTRAYLRAAFEVRPADRLLERVPHELLLHLSPALRSLPSGTPWPPRTLTAYRVVKAWRTNWARAQRLQRRLRRAAPARGARQRERIVALRTLLPHWRERFLDHPHAATWQVIDRDRFERLTAPGANEAEQAAQFVGLYQAGTVLTFEEDLRTWTARWNGDATATR
jgi:asparagine synthetase B (glutamine-hydrolysing)